jgi:hypothetical protein
MQYSKFSLKSRRHSDQQSTDEHALMLFNLRSFDGNKCLEKNKKDLQVDIVLGRQERSAVDALRSADADHKEARFLETKGITGPHTVKGVGRKHKMEILLNRTRRKPAGFRQHFSDFSQMAHLYKLKPHVEVDPDELPTELGYRKGGMHPYAQQQRSQQIPVGPPRGRRRSVLHKGEPMALKKPPKSGKQKMLAPDEPILHHDIGKGTDYESLRRVSMVDIQSGEALKSHNAPVMGVAPSLTVVNLSEEAIRQRSAQLRNQLVAKYHELPNRRRTMNEVHGSIKQTMLDKLHAYYEPSDDKLYAKMLTQELEIYSDQSLLARESLRFDRSLKAALERFFDLTDTDCSGTINQDEYETMFICVFTALKGRVETEDLNPDEEYKAIAALARDEFREDCLGSANYVEGSDIMDKRGFVNAWFQLAGSEACRLKCC